MVDNLKRFQLPTYLLWVFFFSLCVTGSLVMYSVNIEEVVDSRLIG